WGDDRLVYAAPDGPVCQCCQPSACFGPDGRLHVLWRNSLAGARDMFLVSSADGGRTFDAPRKLGQGTWELKACPMDGGGPAVGPDGAVVTVWRRQQTLFRCVDGRAEESLGRGEQARAAAGPGGVYLAWVVDRPGTLMALPPDGPPARLAGNAV